MFFLSRYVFESCFKIFSVDVFEGVMSIEGEPTTQLALFTECFLPCLLDNLHAVVVDHGVEREGSKEW